MGEKPLTATKILEEQARVGPVAQSWIEQWQKQVDREILQPLVDRLNAIIRRDLDKQ